MKNIENYEIYFTNSTGYHGDTVLVTAEIAGYIMNEAISGKSHIYIEGDLYKSSQIEKIIRCKDAEDIDLALNGHIAICFDTGSDKEPTAQDWQKYLEFTEKHAHELKATPWCI